MNTPEAVPREKWLTARKELLAAEKRLTHVRDEVNTIRRELPWSRSTSRTPWRDLPDRTPGPRLVARSVSPGARREEVAGPGRTAPSGRLRTIPPRTHRNDRSATW
jgi:hypothetical protein